MYLCCNEFLHASYGVGDTTLTSRQTTDHNVPTTPRKNFKNVEQFVEEADSRLQCMTLEDNVKAHGLTYFGLGDKRQGIVHIIGPEQGWFPKPCCVSAAIEKVLSRIWEVEGLLEIIFVGAVHLSLRRLTIFNRIYVTWYHCGLWYVYPYRHTPSG